MKEDLTNHNKPKKESMWLNLGFNLIIPILFLRKGDEWFGPSLENILDSPKDGTLVGSVMLLLAIAFPIGYGAWDFYRRRKWNFLSILGALSAFLTGGIGLLPGATVSMFAIKEAALPGILGLLTVLTLKTNKPLVKLFLYNPDVIQVDLVDHALSEKGTIIQFNQLLKKCTWLIALTFIMSASLNYFLARAIVITEPSIDKLAFNDEVGKMMGWSFPIISLPCMLVSAYAFWLLIKGIKNLAGLSLEDVLVQGQQSSKTKLT
jgi:hypothetical protein